MSVTAYYQTVVPNTCGVGVMGDFREITADWMTPLIKQKPFGGAGYEVAGFTNESPAYKEAYETLKKRWKILYQSPVRKNKRSGHKFFFCVYDTRSKP